MNLDQIIKSAGFFNKDRIQGLSDGVSAIAVTLLVLDLHVPSPNDVSRAGGLTFALATLWPKYLAYCISFTLLGSLWIGHHVIFHFTRRIDRPLLWINIFFLMCLASVPFITALVSEYRHEQSAIVIYGCTMTAISLVLYAQWWYATRGRHLVDNDLDPAVIAYGRLRLLVGPLVYLVAVIISFATPEASLFVYLAAPILYAFHDVIGSSLRRVRRGAKPQ